MEVVIRGKACLTMKKIITPSVIRCTGNTKERAEVVNGIGCSRVHVDVSLDKRISNFYDGETFGKKERSYFKSHVDFHVFGWSEMDISIPILPHDRMIMHCSGKFNARRLIEIKDYAKCMKAGFGISIDHDMKISALDDVLRFCDIIMMLTIPIGSYGVKPAIGTKDHIERVKKYLSSKGAKAEIAIDGGVDHETFPFFIREATTVVVGGLLFKSTDVLSAWKMFDSYNV